MKLGTIQDATRHDVSFNNLEGLGWGQLVDPNDLSKGKYYPLHEYQQKIYASNKRFTAAVAGTGGGKTVVGALWTIRKIQEAIQKYGKALGMIVAPTYKVLSRATMPTFIESLDYTALGIQAGGRYFESKSYYELPNKWGKIWAQGADNPYGLEGGQFDFVWMDEGGQLGNKAFNAVTGRTGAKQGSILVTTTPYISNEGFGPLHKVWMPAFQSGDQDYLMLHFPSIANPAYPQEEFERAKRNMTPETFKARYEGLFVAVEGLVYPAFNRTLVNLNMKQIKELLSECETVIGGLDFGWNDPFAGLAGCIDKDDVLWIWYERYKSQTVMEVHADALPKFKNKSLLWYSEHDPQNIRTLKRAGHRIKRAPKHIGISAGIIMVNGRIYSNKLKVIENRCPAAIAEAEQYHYPEKNEEVVGDKPIDKDNHAMDALRYLITGHDRKQVI